MNQDQANQLMSQQLMRIISGLNLTVSTHRAAEMKAIIQHFNTHVSSRVNFSTTLYDLKEQQVVLHNSFYNQYFQSQVLNPAIRNNTERLLCLTCPQNIGFCLQTELIIINQLQKLSTEELQTYEARYIRYLKEKDGEYHSYVIYVQVYEFDECGRPWMLKIDTIRTEANKLQEFRWFSHTLEGYIEEHANSLLLQNLNLTEKEKRVLKLLVENKTMGAIGKITNRNPSTVQSYYNNLEQKMNVHSIAEVREIGRILGKKEEWSMEYEVYSL